MTETLRESFNYIDGWDNLHVMNYHYSFYHFNENNFQLIIKFSKEKPNVKDSFFIKKEHSVHKHKIKSLNEYIDLVNRFNNCNPHYNSLFYRGHSKLKYELKPNVLRDYKDKESDLYRMFMIENSANLDNKSTTLDLLMKMQHYKLPTRLLDLITNPLVALWFATNQSDKNMNVENDDDEEDDLDHDGNVLLFEVNDRNIKYYDSDSITCLSNLAKLTKTQKYILMDNIHKFYFELIIIYLENISEPNLFDFNDQDEIFRKMFSDLIESDRSSALADEMIASFNKENYYLLHYIKNDKPYFLDKVNPIDLHSNLFINVIKNNARLKAQSGAFIVYGLMKTKAITSP